MRFNDSPPNTMAAHNRTRKQKLTILCALKAGFYDSEFDFPVGIRVRNEEIVYYESIHTLATACNHAHAHASARAYADAHAYAY